ncbi:class I SAM-dependent methyltransferase [Nocardia lasii]|uniref:Class I SAM-dependent methyltransferase n=1 Tax=Nocardia lasii TaxID=1616107 RepID=A0ABW1JNC8_9NOCA
MTITSPSAASFARWYPRLMNISERAGQDHLRRDLLRRAHGRTLEVGAGNGFSMPHYPEDLDELVLVEPNPALRTRLAARVDRPAAPVRILDGDAHALDFPDNSFDTVTASLVFCSLPHPTRALAELHRVLRPGGVFLFHEHVRATGTLGRCQDLITPLQRRIADGCHANRDFHSLLVASDFEIVELHHTRMPRAVPVIAPLVTGVARRG